MPAPVTGQATAATSGNPLSQTPVSGSGFTVKAPSGNGSTVYLGPSGVTASTGYPLSPGETFEYQRRVSSGQPVFELNVSDFYVAGTSPDKVAWLVSP